MPDSETTKATFEALLASSGLKLSDAQKKDLLAGYGYVRAMAARVRGDGARPREAEPAGIFKADR